MDKEKVFKAYANYVWANGQAPESIQAFCNVAEIELMEFKVAFQSLENIKKQLLAHVFESVWNRVEKATLDNEYSPREECLALFFMLIEGFTDYRDYLKASYKIADPTALKTAFTDWRSFNHLFVEKTANFQTDDRLNWLRDKLPSAITQEVNSLLMAWNYVFRVWLADETEDFATTDAAIEKVIHLYFDLASTKQLEQLLDFGKFVAATKVTW